MKAIELLWPRDMQTVKVVDHARGGDIIFEGSVPEFAAWALVEKYGAITQTVESPNSNKEQTSCGTK
jgi:hypothetical protein